MFSKGKLLVMCLMVDCVFFHFVFLLILLHVVAAQILLRSRNPQKPTGTYYRGLRVN